MESSDLRIFQKVAELKSITRAAQALHFVQSHVTGRMKRLEAELQTTLFERLPTGVTLTPDGDALLFYADKVLSLLEQAAEEFRKAPETLRIGAPQTLAASRLPEWLAAFRKQSPKIQISITTAPKEELTRLLTDGQLDCAFLQTEDSINAFVTLARFTEPLSLAAPAACVESALKSLPLLVNAVPSCPYRKMLTEWHTKTASALPVIIELDTVEALLRSVSLGMGITLLPAVCIPKKQAGIAAFFIPELHEITCRLAAPRAMQNRAALEFSEVVRNLLN